MRPTDLAQALYLNEHNVERLLGVVFPGRQFHRGKVVPGSALRFKPDFRCDDPKVIVEFDGYGHYRNAEDVYWDRLKDKRYAALHFKVIRIPYFVQPCAETIAVLFDVGLDYPLRYQHGFVDPYVVLPSDFCNSGIDKFLADLDKFACIRRDIVASLRPWITTLGHIDRVLPRCLHHLLNEAR